MEDKLLKCLEECLKRDTTYVDDKHLTSDFVKSFGITNEYPGLAEMVERVLPDVIKKLMTWDSEASYQKIYEICTCLPVDSELISKALNQWLGWWLIEHNGFVLPRNFGLLELWFKVSINCKLRTRIEEVLNHYSDLSYRAFVDFTWQIDYLLNNYTLLPKTRLDLKMVKLIGAVMAKDDAPSKELNPPTFINLSDEEALIVGSTVCDLILVHCSVKEIKRLLYLDLWNKGRLGIKAHLTTPSAKSAAVQGILQSLEYRKLDNTREIAAMCQLTKDDFSSSNARYIIQEIISLTDTLDNECELVARVAKEMIGLTRSQFNRLITPVLAHRLRNLKFSDTVSGVCQFMQNLGMPVEQIDKIVRRAFLKILTDGGRGVRNFCEYLSTSVCTNIPGVAEAARKGLVKALTYSDSESAIYIHQNFSV